MSAEEQLQALFILGAHRSGTTQILRLCKDVFGYRGGTEGYVWQSVKVLNDHFARLIAEFEGEQNPALKNFSVTLFTPQEIVRRYTHALLELHRAEFGSEPFVDKTPGFEGVSAAPLVLQMLPAARFIFMRRRGIENVMSNLRRFPHTPFRTACLSWARPMQRWLEVRERVASRSIEVDQRDLGVQPLNVASQLVFFLRRGDADIAGEYLLTHFPEKTQAGGYASYIALRDTGWDEEQRETFREVCGGMMAAYGYPMDSGGVAPPPGRTINLASPAYASRWQVANPNQWVSTAAAGIHLHANDPRDPAPLLTLKGCLEPGSYRYDAEVLVFEARCPALKITLAIRGQHTSQALSFDLAGGRPGPVAWEIPSLVLKEICDVEISLTLAGVTSASYSAIQLVSATFTAQGGSAQGDLGKPS
jgi:hypothetical protein